MPALFTFRSAVLAALVAGLGCATSACYVEDEGPPAAYASYEPAYYDGYVVYYDSVGRPYYYAGDRVYWVPQSSPVYVGLVNHYRYYRPYYSHWYGHYGYRYRGYRSAPRAYYHYHRR
jgi:hypothetical protein